MLEPAPDDWGWITFTTADGTVTAVVSGDCFVRSIVSTAASPSPQATAEAVNQGIAQAKNAISQKISEATGGLPVPGLF